ncbi:unnamed protein product [Closterium sp. Naga37s-1]|nr:unnamed protein product [Closterium sp. Naga37s-1]
MSDAERRRMAGLGGAAASIGGLPPSRRHRTVAAFVAMSLVLAAYVMGVAPSLPRLGRAILRKRCSRGGEWRVHGQRDGGRHTETSNLSLSSVLSTLPFSPQRFPPSPAHSQSTPVPSFPLPCPKSFNLRSSHLICPSFRPSSFPSSRSSLFSPLLSPCPLPLLLRPPPIPSPSSPPLPPSRASRPSDPITRWTRRLAEGAALAAVREGIRPLAFRPGPALLRPRRRREQAEGEDGGAGGGVGGGRGRGGYRAPRGVEEADECGVPRRVGRCGLRKGERVHVAVVSQGEARNALVLTQLRLLIASIAAHTRCPLTFHLVIPPTDLNATLATLHAFPAVRIHPLPSPFISVASPLATTVNGSATGEPSAAGSLQFDAVGASSGYQESKSDLRKLSAVPFLLAIHALPMRWLKAQARLLGTHPNLSPDGPAALGRFLLADILWQVEAAIVMQPDVIVGGDVQELWKMIERSKGTSDLLSLIVPLEEFQLVGSGGEGEQQQQGGLLGIGGWFSRTRARISLDTMRVGNGVLLMNLERLRLHGTGKLLSRALQHRPLTLEPLFDHNRLESSLFLIVCRKFPRTCAPLSPLWAMDGCSPGAPFSGFSSHSRDAATGMCWMLAHMHCQAPVRAENVIEVKGKGQGGELDGVYGALKGEGREQEREDAVGVYRLPEGAGWEEAVQFAMNYFAASGGDGRAG